jgi:hypothetical protein
MKAFGGRSLSTIVDPRHVRPDALEWLEEPTGKSASAKAVRPSVLISSTTGGSTWRPTKTGPVTVADLRCVRSLVLTWARSRSGPM